MELGDAYIWHAIKHDPRQLSEAGGGPKSKVFYLNSAILPTFKLCMCSNESQLDATANVDIQLKLMSIIATNTPILTPIARAVL